VKPCLQLNILQCAGETDDQTSRASAAAVAAAVCTRTNDAQYYSELIVMRVVHVLADRLAMITDGSDIAERLCLKKLK